MRSRHVGSAPSSGLGRSRCRAAARRPRPGRSASKLWIVAGGASTTVRGDCQTCEEDFDYRHAGSIFGDFGVPRERPHGRRRRTVLDGHGHRQWPASATRPLDAVAQFRPWSSQGFFIKGGAGMAFIRNWVDVLGPDAIQLESPVGGHRRRLGVPSRPHASAGRCSACSTPRRSATCRRPRVQSRRHGQLLVARRGIVFR